MLTDRYRIVGLLGKGGMGEVYRADDLKLRQPVALKFLPEALSKDRRRLDRFHHEVRVAREVSHPNVCRVYDIGESEGHAFITMEYIDGEDLASLVRRMGRPSKDKALQIARQLCAGLAAAHDKGVLHRDLKPHNVMIDGRGTVRITDFGLAGFAEDFAGAELRAGTPAYMAPEQIEGRNVSVKSDIYSLGMVLFELFTGRRAFEGASRADLQRSRSSLSPTSVSTLVPDVDPVVERVILRCLEREPSARPSSALAVAAALPGGDPLAAALAAGETPAPEMVAAAGEVGGMRPAVAIPCFLGIVLGTLAVAFLRDTMNKRVPLEKPADALVVRAAEVLKKLGHTSPAVDTAYGWSLDDDYVDYIKETDKSPTRWDRLSKSRPAVWSFWYRQSPRTMIPHASVDRITPWDVPLDVSGMGTVWLDQRGRLKGLEVNPPEREEVATVAVSAAPTNWSVLFAEAELDQNSFSPTAPRWTPNHFCDERAAWDGHYSEAPDIPVHVEGGAYRGKPNWFSLTYSWTIPGRIQEWSQSLSLGEKLGNAVETSLWIAVTIGGILLARRNLRLRRGDRGGATRLASAYFGVMLAGRLLSASHVADLAEEVDRVIVLASRVLFEAATLWLSYVALEPYVRRRWPQSLISWSRLLAGRFRDPLVGRDILVGGLLIIVVRLVHQGLEPRVIMLFGAPPGQPRFYWPPTLMGGRDLLGGFLDLSFLAIPFFFLFILFVLRILLRKEWLAVVGMIALWFLPSLLSFGKGSEITAHLISALAEGIHGAIIALALVRFGVLVTASMWCFDGFLWPALALDLNAWYAAGPLAAFFLVIALAAYGCHTALAGRPLLKDELLEG